MAPKSKVRAVAGSLLLLLLAGCAQPEPAPVSAAQALLDAYKPVEVSYITVEVVSTLRQPLDEAYYNVRHVFPPLLRLDEANRTLWTDDPAALWLYKDGDIVVDGSASVVSNKHDGPVHSVSVQKEHGLAQINTGGIQFQFKVGPGTFARAWYLGMQVGSYSRTLPPGWLFLTTLERNVSLWMADTTRHYDDQVEVKAVADTNITLENHGNLTLRIEPETLDSLHRRLDRLERDMDRQAADLVPGGRFGQRTDSCPPWTMKSYDPCMDPDLRPRP